MACQDRQRWTELQHDLGQPGLHNHQRTRRNEPHIGFLQADGPTVSIRDGYGRVLTLAREDLATRVPLKSSLMPDPLALALTEQDVADIAAFLMKPVSR